MFFRQNDKRNFRVENFVRSENFEQKFSISRFENFVKSLKQWESEILTETEKRILQLEKFVRPENFEKVTNNQINIYRKIVSCRQKIRRNKMPAANKRFTFGATSWWRHAGCMFAESFAGI